MSTRKARDPRQQLPLPAHDLHILLALLEAPKHGYAVIQAVAAATDGAIELGTSTVYAALKRMVGAGLIVETRRPATEVSEDVRRRYYTASAFGREVAREAARELDRLHTLVRHARLLDDAPAPRRNPS